MTPATEGTLERIERLSAERTKAQDDLRRVMAALEPFAMAWDIATRNANPKLSMAQLGAIAGHEVAGVHFRNARVALADARLSALTLSKESTHE